MFAALRRRTSLGIIVSLIAVWVLATLTTLWHDTAGPAIDWSSQDLPACVGKKCSHLRHLCDQTQWRKGFWLQCHSFARRDAEGKLSVKGGLTNMRNRLQTCIRLAIEAGAGVIVPSIAPRDPVTLIDDGSGAHVNSSMFWDFEYLRDALRGQCPQLKLRFDIKGVKVIDPPDLVMGRNHTESFTPNTFRVPTTSSLTGVHVSPLSEIAMSFGDTWLAWNYKLAGESLTIQKELFKLLTYNRKLLNISARILQSPQLQNGYIGVHLRAEQDWPAKRGIAEEQMRLYTEEMDKIERNSSSRLRTVYVSSGNRTAIEMFRELVGPFGYTMHDKWSLLSHDPTLLAELEDLLFDEKGAVDYQILFHSDVFLGPFLSSLSMVLAYARTINEPGDFFETYMWPGSKRRSSRRGYGFRRTFHEWPVMKGNNNSKLMAVNGDDILERFP